MKKLSLFTIFSLALLLMTGSAFAASDTKNLTVTATIGSSAKLTLGATTLTFPDSDPDTISSIIATEGAITVTAKAKTATGNPVTLVVRSSGISSGNLVSGSDTIAIANLSWTGAGTGFVIGPTSVTNINQSAGSWTGSGTYSGTQTFSLVNSWAYAVGTYTATITYTLTSP
jgi:hypothetical protein